MDLTGRQHAEEKNSSGQTALENLLQKSFLCETLVSFFRLLPHDASAVNFCVKCFFEFEDLFCNGKWP